MVLIIREIKIDVPFFLFINKKINATKNTNLPSPKKVMNLKNWSRKLLWEALTIIEKLLFWNIAKNKTSPIEISIYLKSPGFKVKQNKLLTMQK